MIKKTVLFMCIAFFSIALTGQSDQLLIEQLKTAVNQAQFSEGRSKALSLALMGYDYIAPGDPQLQQLLYQVYYSNSGEEEYYEEEFYEDTFNASDWSPNNEQLAVALSNGSIRLYNNSFSDYTIIHQGEEDQGILDVDFSPDGKRLAYSDISGFVAIIDIASEEELLTWEHADYIRTLKWSHDGTKLAAGGDENILFIYDTKEGDRLNSFEGHSDWIRNISWSGDDQLIVTASDDATAKVWSIETGELLTSHADHADYCRDVVFAPKGTAFLSSSDDLSAFLYDNASDSEPSKDLGGHEDWIMAVDWSKDGKYIATADNGGTVILNATRTGEQTYYNSVELETAWADIDFAEDNRQFAVTSTTEVAIYKIGSSQPVTRIFVEGQEVNSNDNTNKDDALEAILNERLPMATRLYFSPDQKRLGMINADYQLEVIDMTNGQVLYSITDHEDWIRNISWSKDGQYLATASDDMMVGVWNAETGDMVHFLSGHEDWVRDVDFSPDSKTLLSAGDDGVIRAWDVSTGDELTVSNKSDNFIMTVDWSPNQTHIASQDSEGYLTIWQASDNKTLFKSNPNTQEGSVKWVDDKNLTVISEDGDVFKWNADGGMSMTNETFGVKSSTGIMATAKGPYISISGGGQSAFLEGHTDNVLGMEWSPNGDYLVSYASNNTMGIWGTKGNLVAMIETVGVFNKEIIWLSDDKSFLVAGSPKISLPASSIRQNIEDKGASAILTKEDVISYNLEKIFMSNESVSKAVLQNADGHTLMAFAAFYEQRANSREEGAARTNDEEKAVMFREAAESR